MKASDAVAKILSLNNVSVGFELIGGMITHLVDSINNLGETRLISLHHEQAAAFAAGGIARATNNRDLGLALGTSGPGATNLITGIADCWLDNIPCIFITGQVNSFELKGDKAIRQQGFQELDIVSLVKSTTKHAIQIKSPDNLIHELLYAINVAKDGRPGPVLIDIPMDFQRADINITDDELVKVSNEYLDAQKKQLEVVDYLEVYNLLRQSKKPLFIIGGGACSEDNFIEWQEEISKCNIPHISSLKGSEKTQFLSGYFGMIGAYGTRVANYAVQNADLVIVLGSRLDVRQTGADIKDFARNAKCIVQIDIDEAQLNNRIKGTLSILDRCSNFFSNFLLKKRTYNIKWWYDELNTIFNNGFIDEYPEFELSPFKLVQELSSCFKEIKAQFVADVGNHQMWLAHSMHLHNGQMIHYSGGLGAMGFSLPTAIGLQLATNLPIISISGDGGIQLNIQELDIIKRENLPILVIVLNNHSLGMVKNFQDMYFDGRNKPTFWGGYSCSFKRIGEAYGMESYMVSEISEFKKVINDYSNNPRSLLMEVSMPDVAICKPRLSYGQPIDQQYPHVR